MEEQVLTQEKPRDAKVAAAVSSVKTKTSVIVTVYNFERDVQPLYQSLLDSLQQTQQDFEVIFVDDGSEDNTWGRLKELSADEWRVKLVRLRTRFDESACFDAGFKQASGDKIVFLTTRVRVNPTQIANLLAKLDQDFDLVIGWRHPRRDSRLNQFISWIFNAMVKTFSKLALKDINSGVLAVRREVLEEIALYGNLNIFLPILAHRKGYKVTDEKIEQLAGTFRKSKYVSEYFQRLLDIVTVIFLTNYSKKPLHFLGFFGLIFAICGAAMNLYLFVYRLFQFGPIAGRPLLLLGALLLVIGIQMISIGLIGEMIIFTHAKDIKEYTIEEILD
ncbi:MAG: glycosyltransferase [bacterium]